VCLLRRWAPDLIHVHDSLGTEIGGAAGIALGKPVVLTRRVASPLRRNRRSRRKYSPDRLAAIVAISETVKAVVAEAGYPPERIFVAPTGLDLDALDRVETGATWRDRFGDGPLAVGVGKLSRKKNWELLVRTARESAPVAGEPIRWVVAGEGPERRRLERLAARLGVADRVHFAGFMRDATSLLKAADLLFFPSLMEGASVTVRNSMALGVPVVAVNAAGTAESLAGCGWLIGPEDAAAAAAAVRDVLTDRREREARCARARDVALSRYGMDRMVDGTIAAYRRALG
jgi:glycosyltransferase involved in cell wall biosynthesis